MGFKDFHVYYNLALCFQKTQRHSESILNYEKAIWINPCYGKAIINYSNLLSQTGRGWEAKYILSLYLKNNPNDWRAKLNLTIIKAGDLQFLRTNESAFEEFVNTD